MKSPESRGKPHDERAQCPRRNRVSGRALSGDILASSERVGGDHRDEPCGQCWQSGGKTPRLCVWRQTIPAANSVSTPMML